MNPEPRPLSAVEEQVLATIRPIETKPIPFEGKDGSILEVRISGETFWALRFQYLDFYAGGLGIEQFVRSLLELSVFSDGRRVPSEDVQAVLPGGEKIGSLYAGIAQRITQMSRCRRTLMESGGN